MGFRSSLLHLNPPEAIDPKALHVIGTFQQEAKSKGLFLVHHRKLGVFSAFYLRYGPR